MAHPSPTNSRAGPSDAPSSVRQTSKPAAAVKISAGSAGSMPVKYHGTMFDWKLKMPSAAEALPGRSERMPVPAKHHVLGSPLEGPFPAGYQKAVFALGCFWGAERKFWQLPGVFTTAVGYAAGVTRN